MLPTDSLYDWLLEILCLALKLSNGGDAAKHKDVGLVECLYSDAQHVLNGAGYRSQ